MHIDVIMHAVSGVTMMSRKSPSLQVREVSVDVYDALHRAAEDEHRSLAQQALVTLKRGLDQGADHKARRRRLLDRIDQLPRLVMKGLPSPTSMIREDRDDDHPPNRSS